MPSPRPSTPAPDPRSDPVVPSDPSAASAPVGRAPTRTVAGHVALVLGLALLTVPRVVLHDLHVIDEGTAVNSLLVFVPLVAWIGVVVALAVRSRAPRIPNPFGTLVFTGFVSGVLLVLVHQILWTQNLGASTPVLGGNLADLDPGLQALVFRVSAVFSGLALGTFLGVVTGGAAWVLTRLVTRMRRD